MAVYTEVDRKTLQGFLEAHYVLGPLEDFAGIPEGIQNTNYALKTAVGRFILTLFERRTPEKDLPFFFEYMAHLKTKGFPCPAPVKTIAKGYVAKLMGKPAAIVSFLPGKADMNPFPERCFAAGCMIARLHEAGRDFKKVRPNLFSLSSVNALFKELEAGIAQKWPGLEKTIREELEVLSNQNFKNLPRGMIHTDIFPDNVFFQGEKVTGLIDLYFSSADFLAYDLAISLGCWCFEKNGALKREHFRAMVKGYESVRPLVKSEKGALPLLLRHASLSFLMTRVEDVLKPPANILGVQKDPKEFMNILANQQTRPHLGDYL